MKIQSANPIHIVRRSQAGIEYVTSKILKKSPRTITRAQFWRIPHHSGQIEIALKVGRYKHTAMGEEVEIGHPKSELTLDDQELKELIAYLGENYEPLKDGATQYILVDGKLGSDTIQKLKAFFNKPEKDTILSIIAENDILPAHLLQSLRHQERVRAIEAFEGLLNSNAGEVEWQAWFQNNSWVLGSDFVRVIDDRRIDTDKVADFLVQAYDGFLDIIEIKKPDAVQKFWAASQYRGNYIPSTELVGTIMQATNYIYEVEREANSAKFLERVGYVKVVKPRGVLIYGRSNDWDEDQSKAFRLLNASYHNLTIMTYDHVLQRAKRMLGLTAHAQPDSANPELDDSIPF
ncbi:MAG: DUF4263 domain-containing protein [Alphaproteobacteria bacterium]|nr:DUF4263 domain-containing protein [Alphaproteobacteria bacterium]